MPWKEGQTTLMGFLGMLPVQKVMKKPLFGAPYIRLFNYFEVLTFMYMSGAILGRARHNKLNILGKMLIIPGATAGKAVKVLQDEAKKRLNNFRNEVGKEPDTFYEFIQFRELERATGLSLTDTIEAYSSGNKKIMEAFDEKFPVAAGELFIKSFGLEGIGFGSSFPESTERMYKNTYEHVDMDLYSKLKAWGLALAEKPAKMGLEEVEETVLQMVAAYTLEYYPELLDPLELRDYLESAGGS